MSLAMRLSSGWDLLRFPNGQFASQCSGIGAEPLSEAPTEMRQIGKPCLQSNVGDTKRFGGWIAQESAGGLEPPLQESPAKRFAGLLPNYFTTVSKSPVVWKNVPPAFVYRCRR